MAESKPLLTEFCNHHRLESCVTPLENLRITIINMEQLKNFLSDCLSRLPQPETSPIVEPYELIFTIESLDDRAISCVDIKNITDKDKNLVDLKRYIKYFMYSDVN